MYSTVPLPSETARGLADRLVAIRKDHGWSQAELATRSGVSLGSLKRFEQEAKMSLGNLLKLAHVLQRLGEFERVFEWDADLATVRRRMKKSERR